MVINRKKYRIILSCSVFILSLIGIYMILESSYVWANFIFNDGYYYFKRQCIYLLFGIFIFYLGYKIDIIKIEKYAFKFLLFTYSLLTLVLIPTIGQTKNGSSSWLGFSFLSFQPSEFFKLSIILYMASFIKKNYKKSDDLKIYIKPLILLAIGFILIMLQPDFGTCMVIMIGVISIVFASKFQIKWFILLSILGIIAITVIILTSEYRFLRIKAFLDPFSDPLGSGFQIIQSLYAIGPGGLIGQGINSSIQRYYYLPEPQTDFVFSILIEEFGLIGGIIVIGLYILILYCSFQLIRSNKNVFKSYLDLGLLIIIFSQVFINLGVVTSLIPVTGVTLPLLSYGGSSLIVVLFSFGLIINHSEDKYEDIIS